jgi:Tfp pilus assembly protein PilZ
MYGGWQDGPLARRSDKRRHPRYDGTPLHVRLKIEGRTHPEAMLENISVGGALVMVDDACAPGKNVLLELRDAKDHVKVVARVVEILPKNRRREVPAMRLRFQGSSDATTAKLRRVIRRLSEGDVTADELELDIVEGIIDYELHVEDEDYELKVPDEE